MTKTAISYKTIDDVPIEQAIKLGQYGDSEASLRWYDRQALAAPKSLSSGANQRGHLTVSYTGNVTAGDNTATATINQALASPPIAFVWYLGTIVGSGTTLSHTDNTGGIPGGDATADYGLAFGVGNAAYYCTTDTLTIEVYCDGSGTADTHQSKFFYAIFYDNTGDAFMRSSTLE